ncbi:hypothetical protein BH09VER1_BH09VER1_49480 [soil metagenome]
MINPNNPPPDEEPALARPGSSLGWPEVIVGGGVLVTLLFVSFIYLVAPVRTASDRLRLGFSLSQMKQLHLATQQMALDGSCSNIPVLGWPGDTGGTFAAWANNLVQGGYLGTNDLVNLLRAFRKPIPLDRIPTVNTNGLLVYAVSSNSPSSAVFLTSENFTYTSTGGTLVPSHARFAPIRFAVFRKGGDGELLPRSAVGDSNAVGAYAPLCR